MDFALEPFVTALIIFELTGTRPAGDACPAWTRVRRQMSRLQVVLRSVSETHWHENSNSESDSWSWSWAGSASWGTSNADAQEQTDWTDTNRTWRSLHKSRAVSRLVSCFHRWTRMRWVTSAKKACPWWESTTGNCGCHPRRTLVTLWKQKTMTMIRHGVSTSSPVLCGRNSRDGWSSTYVLQRKGNSERHTAVLSQELMAGGYTRHTVRPDGEAAMVSHVRLAILATMAGGHPTTDVEERISWARLGWRRCAGGEVQVSDFQYELERGLCRTLLENHDTLSWLVPHAAATINWHRTGVGGRTPFQRRTGNSFWRVVAPLGQKNHVDGSHKYGSSTERRCCHGDTTPSFPWCCDDMLPRSREFRESWALKHVFNFHSLTWSLSCHSFWSYDNLVGKWTHPKTIKQLRVFFYTLCWNSHLLSTMTRHCTVYNRHTCLHSHSPDQV